MSTREFDPGRLDVAAFAKEAGELSGRWPLRELTRVAESAAPDAPVAAGNAVDWSARGEARPARGAAPQTWLHLRARAPIDLQCQRCLQPVHCDLEVDRHFLFVHGEDAAARLDEESEDDVLALTRALGLRELVEDELLLAMPLVPRHDVCPEPLPAAAVEPEAAEADDAVAHPFAALAALKRDGPVN